MPGATSIDGLFSGLDTTSIIEALMQAERGQVTLLEQDKTQKTNIVSTLQAFQAKLLALSTNASKLTRSSTFEKTAVDISDDSYLSATASGRVATGSFDVHVLSLARNHQIASQGFGSDSLSNFGTGTISIGVGDGSVRTITIDEGNNSLVGIKNAINDADAGVTATIINDGTRGNQYRLILSAEESGLQNTISMDSSLTGGSDLNFTTATFDSPENVRMNSGTDAEISLGATAAYTGSQNKTYTFTVAGTGSQTVGQDNIVIDWTDGTNSGSILVTQADMEVELVGDGADGLKLSLSAGELNAGDVFQVGTFSPLLQEASDATPVSYTHLTLPTN